MSFMALCGAKGNKKASQREFAQEAGEAGPGYAPLPPPGAVTPRRGDGSPSVDSEAFRVVSREARRVSESQWLSGRAFFPDTGVQAQYLVVPPDCSDVGQLVAAMALIWQLELPKLYLLPRGGARPPRAAFGSLQASERWARRGVSEFTDTMQDVVGGLLASCAEAEPWVYCGQGVVSDWLARLLGTERRRQGHCREKVNLLSATELDGLFGAEELLASAVPARLGAELAQTVTYPRMFEHYFRADGTEVPRPAGAPDPSRVLQGECQYMLLYHKGSRAVVDAFEADFGLRSMLPTVSWVLEGDEPLLQQVPSEANVHPVLLVQGSGGAADTLSEAVLARRRARAQGLGPLEEAAQDFAAPDGSRVEFRLPVRTRLQNIIVFDVNADGFDALTDKVMQALTKSQDAPHLAVGHSANRERLSRAWRMYLTFKQKGAWYSMLHNVLQLAVIIAAFLTTAFSLVQSMLEEDESDLGPLDNVLHRDKKFWQWVFYNVVGLLPLFSSFLMTLSSKFAPGHRWAQLSLAKHSTLAEIFCFRAQGGAYAQKARRYRHQAALSELTARWPDLEGLATAGHAAKAVASAAGGGNNFALLDLYSSAAKDSDSGGISAVEPKHHRSGSGHHDVSRVAFAKELEDIRTGLLQDGVDAGSLEAVGEAEVEAYLRARREAAGAAAEELHEAGLVADDGLSPLTAQQFIALRVEPSLQHFERTSGRLDCWSKVLSATMFLATAATSACAVWRCSTWVPLLVAFASATRTVSDHFQLSQRTAAADAAAVALQNLMIWWESLSFVQQRLGASKHQLVEHAEVAIASYYRWVGGAQGRQRRPRGSPAAGRGLGPAAQLLEAAL